MRTAAHTPVRCYRGDLAGFAASHPGGVGTIDAAALRRFFATLSTQAPATRARKQAALASFLTWCCRQDLLPADPMAELERISVPERSPRGVPPAVVVRVLDTIPKRDLRDRVLFGVIAATGLRAAEALGIYVTDLELARDDEHLTVRGKGGRTRTVLLDDPGLVVLLHRYLRDTGYTRGPLFRANKTMSVDRCAAPVPRNCGASTAVWPGRRSRCTNYGTPTPRNCFPVVSPSTPSASASDTGTSPPPCCTSTGMIRPPTMRSAPGSGADPPRSPPPRRRPGPPQLCAAVTPAHTAETSPPSDSKPSSNAPTWPKCGWNPTAMGS